MKKKIVIVFMFGLLIMIMGGCKQIKRETECLYENLSNSELGNEIWKENIPAVQSINHKSVRVLNQNIIAKRYQIKLEEYFYGQDVPFVIYKFLITTSDGKNLNMEQYKKLIELHDKQKLECFTNDLSGSRLIDKIEQNDSRETVWITGMLLSSISDKDKPSKIIEKEQLESITIFIDNKTVGKLALPDYAYHTDKRLFESSNQSEVLSMEVTREGINIIWDMTDTLREFKEKIQSLSKNENPELYGYTIFENIRMVMKDDKVYKLYGNDKQDIVAETYEFREENKLASYTALWNQSVNIKDIAYILIDGKRYYPR